MIEEALAQHLRDELKVEPVIAKNKYKMKFSLETKGQDDQVQVSDICMRILKVNDE